MSERYYRRDRRGRFTGGHRALSWQLDQVDEIRGLSDEAARLFRDMIVIIVAVALIFFL